MLKIATILITTLIASMNIANAQINDKSRIIRCDVPAIDRLGLLDTSVSYWSIDDFACWEQPNDGTIDTFTMAYDEKYYQYRWHMELMDSTESWVSSIQNQLDDPIRTKNDGLTWYVSNYSAVFEDDKEAFCFEAWAESRNTNKRQYIDFCEFGRIMEFDEATVITRRPPNPF